MAKKTIVLINSIMIFCVKTTKKYRQKINHLFLSVYAFKLTELDPSGERIVVNYNKD